MQDTLLQEFQNALASAVSAGMGALTLRNRMRTLEEAWDTFNSGSPSRRTPGTAVINGKKESVAEGFRRHAEGARNAAGEAGPNMARAQKHYKILDKKARMFAAASKLR